MSDERIRALGRQADAGDPIAREQLGAELCRAGRHDPQDGSIFYRIAKGEPTTYWTPCTRCRAPVDLTAALTVVRQEVVRRRDQVVMDVLAGGTPIEAVAWPGNTGQGIVYPHKPPRGARPGDSARAAIFT